MKLETLRMGFENLTKKIDLLEKDIKDLLKITQSNCTQLEVLSHDFKNHTIQEERYQKNLDLLNSSIHNKITILEKNQSWLLAKVGTIIAIGGSIIAFIVNKLS